MAKDGFSMSNRIVVETVDASKKLTQNDCGKHFLLDLAGGLTASLPTASQAEAGWNCQFQIVTNAAANKAYKIRVPADDSATMNGAIIFGTINNHNHANRTRVTSSNNAGTSTAIYLESSKAGGLYGGIVNVYTDASDWYVNGTCVTSGAVDLDNVFRTS